MRLTEEDISGLDVGDIFYECDYGHNLEARVISKPLRDESSDLWSWAAENTKNGKVIKYSWSKAFSHYGPRLYNAPEYVHFIKGRTVFKFLGEGEGAFDNARKGV